MVRNIELLQDIKDGNINVSAGSFIEILKSKEAISIVIDMVDKNSIISKKLNSDKKIEIFIYALIDRIKKTDELVIKVSEIYEDANIDNLEKIMKEFLLVLDLKSAEINIGDDVDEEIIEKISDSISDHAWKIAFSIAKMIVALSVDQVVWQNADTIKNSLKDSMDIIREKYCSFYSILVILRYASLFKITTYKDWLEVLSAYIGYTMAFVSITDFTTSKFKDMRVYYENEIDKLTNEKNSISEKFKEFKDKSNKDNKKTLKTDIKLDTVLAKIKELDNKTSKMFDNHVKEERNTILSITAEVKHSAVENSYKAKIDSLINQISDLKVENKQLRIDKSNLLKEVDSIKVHIASEEAAVCCKTDDKPLEPLQIVTQTIKQIDENTYNGYALIKLKNKKIYAYIPQAQKEFEIDFSSDTSWLTSGQIVILKEKKILCFEQMHFDNVDNISSEILSIKCINGKNIASNFEGVQVNISQDLSRIKGSNFIVVDKSWLVMPKKNRFTLDSFKEYLDIRGLSIHFVKQKISNGYLIENCVTKDMEFYQELNNAKEGCLAVMRGNEVINIFENKLFYTLSSFYDRKELAMYIEEEDCFVKLNGERIYLKNIATNAKNKDVVYLDENDEYLYNLGTEYQEKFKGFKKISATNGINEKYKTKENIIIFGNISYRNSYTLTFLKEGVKAITIDGFCSKTKLEQSIKKEKPSMIIFDTSYCSHENMWTIKGVTDKYIASQASGAASMLEQYKEKV